MEHDAIRDALLASYEADGGINHLDGVNLPSQDSINSLARDFMHLLFPGYFEASAPTKKDVPAMVDRHLREIDKRLSSEIEKSLRLNRHPEPAVEARAASRELLRQLPGLRKIIQTDVNAAYAGDPAARNVDEIILAYPCVLVISLQRVAHVLYGLRVPLLPRMLTEYAHERTGADLHPGAEIGPNFFIDHCTGVVIGETARIGNGVKLYQGVTLGAKSFEVDGAGNPVKGVKRHPRIGDHVTIYAHATILGGDTFIGDHSVIGSNVWLIESVPANSIVYFKENNLTVRSRRKKEAMVETPSDWMI